MNLSGKATPKCEGEQVFTDEEIEQARGNPNEDAYPELMQFLEDGETVEALVFGDWGWGGYHEPEPPPVPQGKKGKLLSLEEARPLMAGWTFYCGYGAPECYAVNIWTNKRVIWVTQYDGSTTLNSAPRNPTAALPDMPGG